MNTTIISDKRSEGSEDRRWFNLYISPSIHSHKTEDWYQVIDERKTWKNNDQWIRVIKRESIRINYARKSRMTSFDIEVEKHINDTYPIPE